MSAARTTSLVANTAEEKRTPHTPTPWRVDPVSKLDINGPDNYGDVAVCLAREMDSLVIKCNTVGPSLRSQAKANAAFIVRACNSHDALVAALEAQEAAELHQANCSECMHTSRDWTCCESCSKQFGPAIDLRRAALNAAKAVS